MVLIVYLILIPISLAVNYFLIRNAARAALLEANDYIGGQSQILSQLEKIGKTLDRIEKSMELQRIEPLAPTAPGQEIPQALQTTKEAAYLIPGTTEDHGQCSHCGATQRMGRRICFQCAAPFASDAAGNTGEAWEDGQREDGI